MNKSIGVSPYNPTKNVLFVSPEVYEYIEKNQDGMFIEAVGKPPLLVKVIGKGE